MPRKKRRRLCLQTTPTQLSEWVPHPSCVYTAEASTQQELKRFLARQPLSELQLRHSNSLYLFLRQHSSSPFVTDLFFNVGPIRAHNPIQTLLDSFVRGRQGLLLQRLQVILASLAPSTMRIVQEQEAKDNISRCMLMTWCQSFFWLLAQNTKARTPKLPLSFQVSEPNPDVGLTCFQCLGTQAIGVSLLYRLFPGDLAQLVFHFLQCPPGPPCPSCDCESESDLCLQESCQARGGFTAYLARLQPSHIQKLFSL